LPLVTAEQTHGNEVAEVDADPLEPVPVVDGLLTSNRELVLGIAVADCCPVWLWTEDGAALAVVHAGRKGAEGGIAAVAAKKLMARTGCAPGAVRAFLGPCIRPPHYEVDIPALLHAQLAAAGVENRRDCRLDTASDLGRFYSYRMEKGRTGRMLALGWLVRTS
jgi:copper oxidase (laccase) domain-containing protein